MIEAANKQLKYRFLYHHPIPDHKALMNHIREAVQDYNNRPNHVLLGLTPLEVLNGCLPVSHYYSKQIQEAKAFRIKENKKAKCCFYSF